MSDLLQFKVQLVESPLKDTISKYRDDADLQNLIDWVQADWVSVRSILSYIKWSYTAVVC